MTDIDAAMAQTLLHVEDSAESSLPVLVCLHSLFLDGRMFDDLTRAAAGRFRVIRPDFRGQGRSGDLSGGDPTIQQATADVVDALTARGITQAHFVGCSMGGDVALRIAAEHPDMVTSLSLLGTSARPEPAELLDEYRPFVDGVTRSGLEGEVLDFVTASMFGESTRTDPAKAAMVETWRDRMSTLPASIGRSLAGVVHRPDALRLLPDITAPALVISGEECVVRPPDWARELADGLPHAELVLLPAVGHSPLLEKPEIVIERVLAFAATA